jgi:hypothetical protein
MLKIPKQIEEPTEKCFSPPLDGKNIAQESFSSMKLQDKAQLMVHLSLNSYNLKELFQELKLIKEFNLYQML